MPQFFDINNRKYLGSKNRLLDFLESVITKNVSPKDKVFVDIFSGTGVVANHFRKFFPRKVIANDILFSNFVINKVFLNSTIKNVNIKKLLKITEGINRLTPKRGYFYKNFGGSYFTKENAAIIDAIRDEIESLKRNKKVTLQEYYVLLTGLLFAVDKVANTVGQYDAFLKHIGELPYNKKGKHLLDRSIYKKLELKLPIIVFDGKNEVYNKDANQLVREIEADILYLDPPYNHRQYIDSYHVLENIIRWEKPKLFGKTKKFERTNLKSRYCSKKYAMYVFDDLITHAQCKHIFLSYNNEGIIPDNEIIRILKSRGSVKIYKKKYQIFGNGAGSSKNRNIIERIFYCKVKI